MTVAFLLSHFPDQRFIKRMRIANEVNNIKLLYLDRQTNILQTKELEEVIDPYNIYKFNFKTKTNRLLSTVLYTFNTLKILKKINISKLHVGNIDMLLIGYIYKFIFNKDLYIIYEVADLHKIIYNESKRLKDRFLKWILVVIENLLLKKVDTLLLTSPFFWEDYYKGKIPKSKYLFLPNAPNKDIFYDIGMRNESDNIRIGFIGMVRYIKQLEHLLESCKNDCNYFIQISGDGKERSYLEKKYLEFENIVFTGSYDYKKDINNLYNHIDLIYAVYDTNIPNVRIALPNRLYEAIVAEKPIIAAKGSKLGLMVEELEVGYTVSSQNINDVKNLLEYLKENKYDILQKKENCKKIKSDYTFEKYEEILKTKYK